MRQVLSVILLAIVESLIILGLAFGNAAAADKGNLEKVEDCKFFKTKMVVSKTSGARGHVVGGELSKTKHCYYTVRFYMNRSFVIVEDISTYELRWAQEESTAPEKETGSRQTQATSSTTDEFDFGNANFR